MRALIFTPSDINIYMEYHSPLVILYRLFPSTELYDKGEEREEHRSFQSTKLWGYKRIEGEASEMTKDFLIS